MAVPEGIREALADRYTIEHEIGRGGMAVVYLAHDIRHNRPVALKVLLPDVAASQGVERFQREILLAARLQHPHILTVLDSGATAAPEAGREQLWFTMPYVDGESLRDRLNRVGPLSLDAALRIAGEAARALDYAHQHGVIHRDIKPENILLTRDGTTLVADFGIARALDSDDHLTRTGRLMGTPLYMSPEQADEQDLDARTDVYSLAMVLYEMLAGEPPFTGRSIPAIVAKRLSNPTPSVQRLRGDVPAAVDAAIRTAMAPERADRFHTVAEFARALQPGSTADAPVVTPPGDTVPRRVTREGFIGKPKRKPISPTAVALVTGILIGGGLLYFSRGLAPAPEPEPGHMVVAVLPFENLGDSADTYFADGVADEVRTKLASVSGLELIARGSSVDYRGSRQAPAEIARELGADYLLTGTVRWEKASGGDRVRVTPELVDARSGQVARTRWQQQFDASITDVFRVQTDIATRVVDALGVALADSTRRELSTRPTENLAAWDAFLKGEAASGDMKGDQASLRRAIGFYEEAVALDSNFVQAWSQLSRARTSLYSNGVPDPALAEQARVAAERARAINQDDPSVYLAIGDYYGSVTPIDNERAVAEYEQGLRVAPNNVDLLATAAMTETGLGRWDGVADRLARASLLDPRSANTARRLSVVHTFLRNYPAADSAAERALALGPNNVGLVSQKVLVTLARGDLDSARAVIRSAALRIAPAVLYPFFASYQDLYWVLDDGQQRQVLDSRPDGFDGDTASWGIVLTELYRSRGDSRRALVYADSARRALEHQIRVTPDDGQRHALLGLTLAFLGRKSEAVAEGERGKQLMPMSRDAYFGPYVQLQLVRIHLLNGDKEKALDELEPLLEVPFYLSPGWLRIDPTFDAIRTAPRFVAMAGE